MAPTSSIAGHGIGIDVHEPPFLAKGDKSVLQTNMCFTVERASGSKANALPGWKTWSSSARLVQPA